jgi:hypothetical protein
MFSYLAVFILIAAVMQIYSNQKNAEVYRQTRGVIKSRHDLLAVKAAINLSMKLAVVYILLMGLSVARGGSLGQAALCLFIFGIVTLPVGLIGKRYEKKIKTMQVEAEDPEIEKKFQQYLKRWNEPRFGLSD